MSPESEHHLHRSDEEWRAIIRGWVTRLETAMEDWDHRSGNGEHRVVEDMKKESE